MSIILDIVFNPYLASMRGLRDFVGSPALVRQYRLGVLHARAFLFALATSPSVTLAVFLLTRDRLRHSWISFLPLTLPRYRTFWPFLLSLTLSRCKDLVTLRWLSVYDRLRPARRDLLRRSSARHGMLDVTKR